MSLLHKESHDEWRQKRSQEQLALGGLPLNAEYRLRRLADQRRLFTSTLSVNEFVLTRAAGLIPCGQVTGTSVFHIGLQPMSYYSSSELMPLTHAQTQGRKLAIGRMLIEAQQMKAHHVIDVALTENKHDWEGQGTEFTAIGTAVRQAGQQATGGLPFASTLTGQEIIALHQAGYYPSGLALGVCVYYQVASQYTTQVMQGGLMNSTARVNQEMTEYTRGLREARRHAVESLQSEATSQYAEGVLGIKTTQTMKLHEVEIEMGEVKQKRHDLVITFVALGTLIRSVDQPLPSIHPVLSLGS